jgi:hypothetical protein
MLPPCQSGCQWNFAEDERPFHQDTPQRHGKDEADNQVTTPDPIWQASFI